jgi:hypothetical protein
LPDYPDGLNRLPQLLDRIDSLRYDLLELGENAERLEQELSDLAQFPEARVEINRARERRRVRHRRRSSNGRVPISPLAA